MKIKEISVYDFKELSKEAKEKAIEKWYENEDYYYMSGDLFESLKSLLEQNKIKYDTEILKQYYSLSNCQGDGYCFIGKFTWKNYTINITHSSNYCHSNSTAIDIYTANDNEAKESVYKTFKDIYYSICDELEKEGYGIIEYRMNNEEFTELCEANEYTFLENGTMENL